MIAKRKSPQPPASEGVAEVQGLYGPFSFPEKLLQKIWLRGDFERAVATLVDGRRLTIAHPGKWNLLGGPDFLGARLRLGDAPEITGDVELHLHAGDWATHAHARDHAYDGVVLHVVLFPPMRDHVTRGAGGRAIPALALLPLLHHDLEEFAADEAVESLAGRRAQRLPEELFALSPGELAEKLRTHATARWRQKVHFARLRIARLGWEAACHHTALEILGYRFNRAPMLRLATRAASSEWASGALSVEAAFATEAGTWQMQGVRPANHPRTRLRQYAAWMHARADWPAQLAALIAALPGIAFTTPPATTPMATATTRVAPAAAAVITTTRAVRRARHFAAIRETFAALTGGAIGGPRLDTLICDGFLPLLAAHPSRDDPASDREDPARDSYHLARDEALHALWSHWFPGDWPPRLARGLRELGVCGARETPLAHGPAQGLLGWWVAHEARG